jgi:hypothetical protein
MTDELTSPPTPPEGEEKPWMPGMLDPGSQVGVGHWARSMEGPAKAATIATAPNFNALARGETSWLRGARFALWFWDMATLLAGRKGHERGFRFEDTSGRPRPQAYLRKF